MAVDIRIVRDAAACGRLAADLVVSALRHDPCLVLGVATGATIEGTYRELVRRRVDLSQATLFLLDEYIGLSPDDPRSYRRTILRALADPLGLQPNQVVAPEVNSVDLEEACADYERRIEAAGGIAVQLLGIGRNGHIGFNEPGSPFDSKTRPVALATSTVTDNARFFDSVAAVPRRAISQGISTILRSHHLVLVAIGDAKREALAGALCRPASIAVPASAVQLHPLVTVIADQAAAAGLARARSMSELLTNLQEGGRTGKNV